METSVKLAWALLALIHAMPAAVLFAPSTLRRLYGVEPDGDLGVLMTHRGALFLALVLLSLFAIFEPATRRSAGLAVSVSLTSFLVLYARAGCPAGSLRTIAIVDVVALAPLALVLYAGWKTQAA